MQICIVLLLAVPTNCSHSKWNVIGFFKGFVGIVFKSVFVKDELFKSKYGRDNLEICL